MAQIQNLIDDIRFHIQSDFCELNDDLKELAREYAGACREANARLRKCGDFLKQGLRSEAIQLADTEPNLFDQIAMLDFEDRDLWDEVVALYELERAEPIARHLAEALNEAYVEQQPLEALLDRHRLLALGRAPLSRRLEVLRDIAALDDMSLHWDEDVREMEKARLMEIDSELSAIKKNGSDASLQDLVEELWSDEWREEVPDKLREKTRRMVNNTNVTSARKKLAEIEEELSHAFAELNLERAQQLRRQWQEHLPQAKLPPDHELRQKTDPIFGWIADEEDIAAQEQEYADGVAALESALERDSTTAEELEQLHFNITRLEKDLPERLEQHYQNRVHALTTSESRRRKLVIGTSVGVISVLIALFVFMIRSQLKHQEISRIAETVDDMIEDGELAAAHDLIAKNQHLSGSERWLDIELKLKEAEEAEQERADRVKELLSQAERADTYDQAMQALEEAKSIAKGTDEKLAVVELEGDWEKKHNEQIAAMEQDYQERLDNVGLNLQQISNLVENENWSEQLDQTRAQTRSLLSRLQREKEQVRSELSSQVELLSSRFQNLDELATRGQQKSRLLDRLTSLSSGLATQSDSSDPIDEYRQTLKSYAELVPEERRGKDFAVAGEEVVLWKSVLEWNALISEWEEDLPDSAAEAQQRLTQLSEYKTANPQSPITPQLNRYIEYLEPISKIGSAEVSGNESLYQKFDSLYSSRIFKGIKYFKLKTGDLVYVDKEHVIQPETKNRVDYVSEVTSIIKRKTYEIPGSQFVFTEAKPAPHTQIAEHVKSLSQLRSKSGKREDWQLFIKSVVDEILTTKDLDDLFKYYLLKRTLELGAEGSRFMEEAFQPHLNLLEDDEINLLVKWMDPINNDEADEARDRARQVIERGIEGLDKTWEQLEKVSKELPAGVAVDEYVPAGWFARKKSGGVEVRSEWSPKPRTPYQLSVLVPRESGGAQFQSIGNINDQQWNLGSLFAENVLVEGRLVFAQATQ